MISPYEMAIWLGVIQREYRLPYDWCVSAWRSSRGLDLIVHGLQVGSEPPASVRGELVDGDVPHVFARYAVLDRLAGGFLQPLEIVNLALDAGEVGDFPVAGNDDGLLIAESDGGAQAVAPAA